MTVSDLYEPSAPGSEALSCFSCVPREQIAGVSLPTAIANKTVHFPRCDQLRPQAPEDRFRMTCPVGLNKSCIKIRGQSVGQRSASEAQGRSLQGMGNPVVNPIPLW